MMAMYLQDKADSGKKQPNHTLEDVAEEMLNGILCHYEPPDPNRVDPSLKEGKPKKRRGILRAPKMFRRNKKNKVQKTVRWREPHEEEEDKGADEKDDDSPSVLISCNLAGTCVEAGIEAGCVSPSTKEYFAEDNDEDDDILSNDKSEDSDESSPSVRDQRSKKKKSRVSFEEEPEEGDVVFDDEGNPTNVKKRGKKIRGTPRKPRPNEKEKFVPELQGVKINSSDEDERHLKEVSRSSRDGPPSKKYHRPRQDYDYNDDEAYDDQNNSIVDEDEDDLSQDGEKRSKKASSKDKKISTSGSKRGSKSSRNSSNGSDEASETASTTSSLFRRVWPLRKGSKVDSDSDNSVVDSKKGKRVVDAIEKARSSENNGKTGNRRSPSPGRKLLKSFSPKASMRDDEGDWDESIPIIGGGSIRSSNSKARGRSKSPRKKKNTVGEEYVAPPARRDPSPGALRSTRSRSEERDRRRTLDPSDLIDNRGRQSRRSRSPGSHSRSHSFDGSHPLPYMHPAHPLRSDEMDRQSYITAHRNGFDRASSVALSGVSDSVEKQSFITAHRQAHDGFSSVGDQSDRQSYITAHRQGFDSSGCPPQAYAGYQAYNQNVCVPPHYALAPPVRLAYQPLAPPPGYPGMPYPQQYVRVSTPPLVPYHMPPVRGRSRSPARVSLPRQRSVSPSRRVQSQRTRSRSPGRKPSQLPRHNQGGNVRPMIPTNPPPPPPPPPTAVSTGKLVSQPLQSDYKEKGKGTDHIPRKLPGKGRGRSKRHSTQGSDESVADPILVLNANKDTTGLAYTNKLQSDSKPAIDPVTVHSVLPPPESRDDGLSQTIASHARQNIPERVSEPVKKYEELTWEERTRQAWERLRSSLTYESNSTEGESQKQGEDQPKVSAAERDQPPSDTVSDDGTNAPQDAQKSGILKQTSYDQRRVTFGAPTEQIYQDQFVPEEYYDPYPRTRKVFKGKKIFTDLFRGRGKRRGDPSKLGLSQNPTRSTEASSISGMSQEWDAGYYYAPTYSYESGAGIQAPVGGHNQPQQIQTPDYGCTLPV